MSPALCVFGLPRATIVRMGLGPPELLIILAIVLLIFGGSKLPKLARSLGEAKKEFEATSKDDAGTPAVTKAVETKETADGDSPA